MREVHIGIADLGRMTRKKLRELDHVQIVHYRKTPDPAAVLMPYWMWLRLNAMLAAARDVDNAGKDQK